MSELSLFAAIHPKPEHRKDAIAALQGILHETRAEAGCVRFELNVGEADDPLLYLVEHWKSDADLEAHYAQPYTKAVFDKYQGWLAEPVTITRMRRLG